MSLGRFPAGHFIEGQGYGLTKEPQKGRQMEGWSVYTTHGEDQASVGAARGETRSSSPLELPEPWPTEGTQETCVQ